MLGGEAEGVGAVVRAFFGGAASLAMSSSPGRFNGAEDDILTICGGEKA